MCVIGHKLGAETTIPPPSDDDDVIVRLCGNSHMLVVAIVCGFVNSGKRKISKKSKAFEWKTISHVG